MPEETAEPQTFRDRPVSFVRRSGRMSEAQDRAWAELAAHYLVEVPRGAAATSVAAGEPVDPRTLFGRSAPLVVEIGSGQGHAIVHAAASRPGDDFLAIEVFKAGLARTMLDAHRAGVRNLRLVEANAPEVLEHLLPEASVSELWVFFPDPWHKKRHTKRRLVADRFAQVAADALCDGGVLRLATDWEDYALQMRAVLSASPLLRPVVDDGWAPRFEGRAMTAFERKGSRAGRAIRDLAYVREARAGSPPRG